MAYFNAVTPLTEMVRQDDGTLRNAAMCNACKLVWGRMSLAIDCKAQGHRDSYDVEYTTEWLIDGKVSLVETSYPRQALRRDGPEPTQATPRPAPEVIVPELTREHLAVLANAMGLRLVSKPKPKAQAPEPDLLPEGDDEPAF